MNKPSLEDQAAAEGGQQTGGKALEQAPCSLVDLYHAHWHELCNYLKAQFGAGPPEPEDVAQTAFVKFAALKNRAAIENPRAFLYATARNMIMDHHRRERRHQSYAADMAHQAEEKSFDEISPERVLMQRERVEIMMETINRMPREQRRVVILHRLHGLTYTQIAERTHASETTVRRHVAEAIAKIQAALQRGRQPGAQPGSKGSKP